MGVGLGVGTRRMLVASLACATCCLLDGQAACSQPDDAGADSLAAARALFADGVRDEEAGRFSEALEKFLHVREVRDTAPVEYRVGSCEEGIGKSTAAYTAYRQAIALGQGDSTNLEVVRAAVDRLDALGHRVARLMLALPDGAPADVDVRIDNASVARAALTQPVPVEPGPHVVTAAAKGSPPFRSEIFLPAGAQASVTVSLSFPSAALPSEDVPGATPRSSQGRRTAGFVLVGGGAAVVAAAAILLVGRQEDIATLNRTCPRGLCRPGTDAGAADSTRARALVEGPLAAALGGVGTAMAGVGAYLVLSAHSAQDSPSMAVEPMAACGAWGVRVAGSFE
jgi:hypothetical protein